MVNSFKSPCYQGYLRIAPVACLIWVKRDSPFPLSDALYIISSLRHRCYKGNTKSYLANDVQLLGELFEFSGL